MKYCVISNNFTSESGDCDVIVRFQQKSAAAASGWPKARLLVGFATVRSAQVSEPFVLFFRFQLVWENQRAFLARQFFEEVRELVWQEQLVNRHSDACLTNLAVVFVVI